MKRPVTVGIIRVPDQAIGCFGKVYTVDEYCAAHGDEAVTVRKSDLIRPGETVILERRVPRAFFLKLQGASWADAGWRLPS